MTNKIMKKALMDLLDERGNRCMQRVRTAASASDITEVLEFARYVAIYQQAQEMLDMDEEFDFSDAGITNLLEQAAEYVDNTLDDINVIPSLSQNI